MERRQLAWAVPALVVFVFLSSYFGLLGRSSLGFDAEGLLAFDFMAAVWADSLAADVVFVLGTIGAAVACWGLAREHPWWAMALGALAHFLVYVTSFLLLGETREEMADAPLLDTALFVGSWGIVGLAFAALAPPLARRWWMGRAMAARREDAALSE